MISFADILVFLEEDGASGSSCFCLVFLAYVRACNDGERNREAEEGRGRRLFGGVRKRSREGRRADNDIAVSLCSVSQTSCEYWIGGRDTTVWIARRTRVCDATLLMMNDVAKSPYG